MRIYIDETGDTGFKLDKGSSAIFCVTLLVFHDNADIEKMVGAVKRLEERKHFHSQYEWKFNKSKHDLRVEFLTLIKDYNFEIRSVVMNKAAITGPKLKSDKNSFYNYSCKLVLQYANASLYEAKIIFDKRGPREFYGHLKTYLRDKCNLDYTKIKEISSKDSKKYKPLQIVDMVAGAIGRSYSSKSDRLDYISIIKPKIVDLFVFPDDIKKKG